MRWSTKKSIGALSRCVFQAWRNKIWTYLASWFLDCPKTWVLRCCQKVEAAGCWVGTLRRPYLYLPLATRWPAGAAVQACTPQRCIPHDKPEIKLHNGALQMYIRKKSNCTCCLWILAAVETVALPPALRSCVCLQWSVDQLATWCCLKDA